MKRLVLLFALLAAAGCGGSSVPDFRSVEANVIDDSPGDPRDQAQLSDPYAPGDPRDEYAARGDPDNAGGAAGGISVLALGGRDAVPLDPGMKGDDARVVFMPPLGDGHAREPVPDVDPVVLIVPLPPAPPKAVAVFSRSGGANGADTLAVAGNHFLALWDTSSGEAGVVYRVQVLVGNQKVVGWADVALVTPGERARPGVFSAVAGRMLPVKFTISCGKGGCDARPWLERVSVDSDGAEGNGSSGVPAISADGMHVVFSSDAANLVPGDTNGERDVFLHDRARHATTRVSVLGDGAQIRGWSGMPAISADGNKVAFVAQSADVCGCGSAPYSVLVHDALTGETQLASVRADGTPNREPAAHPALSADGRFVAFSSADDEIVPGGNWWEDVFVRDLVTGVTVVGSLRPDGTEASGYSGEPSLSGNGGTLVFASSAPDLVRGDGNGSFDIFVRDLSTGAVVRASLGLHGAEANGDSRAPVLSADGRFVAFQSLASNLAAGDVNARWDVFVHDLVTGATTLVSARGDGLPGSGASARPSISADGRFVAFQSTAPDLVAGDTNGLADVFVRDLATGVTTRASADALGADAFGEASAGAICGSGSFVAFASDAATLVPSDTNGVRDVFVRRLR